MHRSLLPISLLAGVVVASFAPAAHAQSTRIEIRKDSRGDVECFRNGRRIDCDSLRSDRDTARDTRDMRDERADRERERALDRARDARERALERAAEQRELALARARIERERARVRAEDERRRQLDWAQSIRRDIERDLARDRLLRGRRHYYDTRPRLTLGGGADLRRFDDVNRYLVSGGVDFRGASGIGMRPEVMFGWTDIMREQLPTVSCPACSALPSGLNTVPVELRSRSKVLGVNLNATYTMLRGSIARPYLLGGLGVLSTREATPVVTSTSVVPGNPTLTQLSYSTQSHDRVNLGMNVGAGLEFGRGPVRLFTEFRYFLNDTPTPRGFSGMLPITAGLRF